MLVPIEMIYVMIVWVTPVTVNNNFIEDFKMKRQNIRQSLLSLVSITVHMTKSL